ncbi:MKI67 FHA domain-interacting nucleolar phosphoprotein-like isoform X2 [Hydra vulgaris]|uniref:MKI67 FHA domain-interacting nucleolar phosphoprotein-like isoform X2 n=1 Tax=Hydra vulgaris TaxID=6087 RepID=A0ABM4CXC8_HYDVU
MASEKLVGSLIENLALKSDQQAEFNKKIAELSSDVSPTGTIYIGHLPRGFYENEIKKYFSQFGVVNKVRLARSKKTGGHKGYGYVQFANEDVAKIAAEAMNNYLMFNKLLKCQFVPNEKLHPKVWKGCNKKFVWINKAKLARQVHNKRKTKEASQKAFERLNKRDKKKREKLLACGIKFEFPGYAGSKIKNKLIKKDQKAPTPKTLLPPKTDKKKRKKKEV